MPSLLRMLARWLSTVLMLNERGRDFLRAVSFGDQFEYLELAWGQQLEFFVAFVGARDDVADEGVDGGGVEERLAAHRRPTGGDDVVVRSGLQDVA
jgi:hypothetical protein